MHFTDPPLLIAARGVPIGAFDLRQAPSSTRPAVAVTIACSDVAAAPPEDDPLTQLFPIARSPSRRSWPEARNRLAAALPLAPNEIVPSHVRLVEPVSQARCSRGVIAVGRTRRPPSRVSLCRRACADGERADREHSAQALSHRVSFDSSQAGACRLDIAAAIARCRFRPRSRRPASRRSPRLSRGVAPRLSRLCAGTQDLE